MQKRRILVVGTTYPRWKNDSVSPFLYYFCENMAKKANKLFVLAPHFKGAKRNEVESGVSVHRFRYMLPESAQNIVYGGGGVFQIKKTPVYALKLFSLLCAEFFSMLRLSSAHRITIINAHWIIPQGFIAVIVKILTGGKVVISVHGSDIFSLKGKTLTAVKRFALHRADFVVANSTATMEACQAVYSEVRIKVIPMGIDTDHFKPAPKPKYLIEKYDLKGKFTILFAGRLTSIKGVIYLMRSLKDLKEAGVPFKAIIVGEGPDRTKHERYVKESGLEEVVVFAGWVGKEELLDYYHVADVFVGPSLHEAQGLVFLEAQATGLPVIATRVGGLPDSVNDGETGYLVQTRDSQAITEKLQLLYNEPKLRKRMSENAHKSVGEHFSWESVSERYDNLFKDIAQE